MAAPLSQTIVAPSHLQGRTVSRSARYGTVLSWLAVAVIAFNYFEFVRQFWLVKFMGGYAMKIWVPPALIFALVWTVKLNRNKLQVPAHGLRVGHYFLLGYVAFGVLSLVSNEGLYNVGKFGLIMFAPLILYLVILEIVPDNQAIEKVLKVLFPVGIALALYTEYIFLIGIPTGSYVFETIQTNVGEQSSEWITPFTSGQQAGGVTVLRHSLPGLEQSKFSGMLSFLILAGLYLGTRAKNVARLYYFLGSAVMFMTVMACFSRSAIMALVIGILAYAWYYARGKAMVVPAAGAALVTLATNDFILDRFLLTFTGSGWFNDWEWVQAAAAVRGLTEAAEEEHLESSLISMQLFLSSPFLGVGITKMQTAFYEIGLTDEHNHYFWMVSTAGLLTLAPYVAFLVWLMMKTRRVLLTGSVGDMENARLGALLLAAVLLCIAKLNAESTETYFYWVMFGLAAVWIRNTLMARQARRRG